METNNVMDYSLLLAIEPTKKYTNNNRYKKVKFEKWSWDLHNDDTMSIFDFKNLESDIDIKISTL